MRICTVVMVLVALCAAGAPFVTVSDASPPVDEPRVEESVCALDEGLDEAPPPGCDCWGSYSCTAFISQKWLYDMGPGATDDPEDVSCSLMTREQARAACDSACSGTCTDDGVTCAE
jgi:hypothetical protein